LNKRRESLASGCEGAASTARDLHRQMSRPHPCLAALISLAFAALVSPAMGSTTLGETGSSTVACDGPASYVQTTTGGPPVYEIPPGGGVITSWTTLAGLGGAHVKLAVLRATGEPNQFTTVATSADERLTSFSLNSFATSLPAQAGDVLGLLIISGAHNCVLINTASADDRGVREVGTVFDAGAIGTYSEPSQPARRLNLTATMEADANADGIGDEAPATKITKAPPRQTNKDEVKFEFTSNDPGASFECKLDKGPYKRCASPRKVKVDEGPHTFAVRAVDADGHRDPSAETARFTKQPRRDP
jgi:hypothetical protein